MHATYFSLQSRLVIAVAVDNVAVADAAFVPDLVADNFDTAADTVVLDLVVDIAAAAVLDPVIGIAAAAAAAVAYQSWI